PEMASCRDVDDVGVRRVKDDAPDVMGVGKTHELPFLSAVGGLVDAIAPGRTLAVIGFARSDPDNIGVGLRNGDVTDRTGRLIIEEGFPGRAVISGLEDTAGCGADIDDFGV